MRYFGLFVIVAALVPPVFAGGNPPMAETIAVIAKSQEETLAAYEREITSWQIDYEAKSFGPGGDLLRHAKYTQRYTPTGLARSTETVIVDKESRGGGKDSAWARNKQYSFTLQKSPDSSEWVMEGAKHYGAESPGKPASRPAHPYAGFWFTRHLYTADRRLFAYVFRDKKFVVKSCSTSPANKDWVRVTGEIPATGRSPALKGWWDFDPAMGYCCRGLEVTSTYPGGAKSYSTVEHDDFSLSRRDSGLITLDSYKFTGHTDYSGQIKDAMSGEWTFTYRRDPNIPESEFTLTAFGLPEPYFATPQRSYTWLYLAAGAVVAAVAAWLIGRRYARRRVAA